MNPQTYPSATRNTLPTNGTFSRLGSRSSVQNPGLQAYMVNVLDRMVPLSSRDLGNKHRTFSVTTLLLGNIQTAPSINVHPTQRNTRIQSMNSNVGKYTPKYLMLVLHRNTNLYGSISWRKTESGVTMVFALQPFLGFTYFFNYDLLQRTGVCFATYLSPVCQGNPAHQGMEWVDRTFWRAQPRKHLHASPAL